MIIRLILLLIITLNGIEVCIFAQDKISSPKISVHHSGKKKPSVYLSFERVDGKPSTFPDMYSQAERITLRFHNNFDQPVAVDANFFVTEIKKAKLRLKNGTFVEALPDGANVEVCYQAEARAQITVEEFDAINIPKQYPSSYSCKWTQRRRGRGTNWVLPGNSFTFSVPRTFFGENMMVFTVFNYEWEVDENGNVTPDAPVHQVYFYSQDLPYELKMHFKKPL